MSARKTSKLHEIDSNNHIITRRYFVCVMKSTSRWQWWIACSRKDKIERERESECKIERKTYQKKIIYMKQTIITCWNNIELAKTKWWKKNYSWTGDRTFDSTVIIHFRLKRIFYLCDKRNAVFPQWFRYDQWREKKYQKHPDYMTTNIDEIQCWLMTIREFNGLAFG